MFFDSMNTIRQASIHDIPKMQEIRRSVFENKLSDPKKIKDEDYIPFLEQAGCGWIAESEGEIVGFTIIDLINQNVWALFVKPEFENRGIGTKLHDTMLNWCFSKGMNYIWLSTEKNTRAENFYRHKGWQPSGFYNENEIKFEYRKN